MPKDGPRARSSKPVSRTARADRRRPQPPEQDPIDQEKAKESSSAIHTIVGESIVASGAAIISSQLGFGDSYLLKKIADPTRSPKDSLMLLLAMFQQKAAKEWEKDMEPRRGRFPWSPELFRKLPKGTDSRYIETARRWGRTMDCIISVPIPIPGIKFRYPLGAGFFAKLPPGVGPVITLALSMSIYSSACKRAKIPIDPILTFPLTCLGMERALSAAPGAGPVVTSVFQAEVRIVSTLEHFVVLRMVTKEDRSEGKGKDRMWYSGELSRIFKRKTRYPHSVRLLIHPDEGYDVV